MRSIAVRPTRLVPALVVALFVASPVGAQITADFGATPTSGLPPLVVSFTDQTTGGTPVAWQWDFGDGTQGFAQHPVHVYDTPGTYTVSLGVLGQGGGADSEVKTGLVTVSPASVTPDFVASPTSGFLQVEVSFTNTTTGDPVSSWLWDFGDGGTSTAQHPTHTYTGYGDYDVTLTAFAGTQPATITKPGLVSISAQFSTRRDLPGILPPSAFATGDVDGDDDVDILVAANAPSSPAQIPEGAYLLRNLDGAGTFGQPETIHDGATATDPDLGDIDGDGDLDLLYVFAGRAWWAENVDGQGAFQEVEWLQLDPATVRDTTLADLDGDGLADAVLAYDAPPSLRVHFADGAGFGAETPWHGGPKDAYGLDVADLDGDGDLDAVVGGDLSERLVWFANDGAGAFPTAHSLDVGAEVVQSVRAGDVDGDGDRDLVFGGARLGWLENLDGLGTFGAPQTVVEGTLRQVELADLDRDGDLDVIALALPSFDLLLFENTDGLGGFAAAPQAVLTVAGDRDDALGLGDLDRDGDLDVLGGARDFGVGAGWYENVGLASPWTFLGGAAPGVGGVPALDAIGTLEAGDPLTLHVTDAPGNALMLAWLSFTSVPLDVLGGTLHANPPAVQLLRATDAEGAWSQSLTWPVSVGTGVEFWLQFIVQDGTVPAGLTLTNAVTAITP